VRDIRPEGIASSDLFGAARVEHPGPRDAVGEKSVAATLDAVSVDARIMRVQEALTRVGYPVAADGIVGPQTRGALRAFQLKAGLEPTGEADDATLKALDIQPEQTSADAAARPTLTVKPQAISDEAVGDVNQDSLGFRPYVEALVRFMRARETKPPLAIAVRAPWGRGKTSFMKMIDAELNHLPSDSVSFATCWFNPWKCNAREELWTAYLATVTTCIHDHLSFRRRAGLWSRRYFSDLRTRGQLWEFGLRSFLFLVLFFLFLWVAFGVGMTTLTAALVDAIFERTIAEAIKSTLGGWLLGILGLALVIHQAYMHAVQKFNLGLVQYLRADPGKQTVASLGQFENELQLLADATPENLKVVIFIDDLDRCEPEILWEVLVAQQLVVVSSRCIFILGMDLDIVARTLDAVLARHSQGPSEPRDEFAHGRGYRFLEKIMQTRISIPAYGPDQIETFVEQLLPRSQTGSDGREFGASVSGRSSPAAPLRAAEEVTDDSPELRSAIVRYAPAYFENPRRIKRFVNGLRLHAYLASASGFAVDVDQLARFLVLTERWPRLVAELLKNEAWLRTALEGEMPPGGETLTEQRDDLRKVCQLMADDHELHTLFTKEPAIDHPRLRELAEWYGFSFCGDGEPEGPTQPQSSAG
jgi:peptidoglycan hydrolase-like protein with peptidoglycan-binding domain